MRKNTKKKLITGLVLWLSMILAMPVYGDDTEIYGGITRSVKPNVLILFDTSGSMRTRDVVKDGCEPYDPTKTYKGGQSNCPGGRAFGNRDPNAIFAEISKTSPASQIYDIIGIVAYFDPTPSQITAAMRRNLNTYGYAAPEYLIRFTTRDQHGVPHSYYAHTLFTGNFLNWVDGMAMTRQTAAIEAITEVVRDTEGVRFGLMRLTDYPPSSGFESGQLVLKIEDMEEGTNKARLLYEIANLPAKSNTPLANALSEAGWYFAGKKGWKGEQYTSPVKPELYCQYNYIILMTDGVPTRDNDYLDGDYIHGAKIPRNNIDAYRLVDVAEYLYTKGTLPGRSNEGKQIVSTYTIGFKTDQALLKETARVGSRLGEDGYFTVNTKEDLKNAFETLIGSILQVDSIFVSPVVPVNQQNRTFAGDSLYVGFFRPNNSAAWEGNLKKYALDADGNICSKDGRTRATHATTGAILDTAQSFWSDGADGKIVPKGGAGGVLQRNTARNLYTNLDEDRPLSDEANKFSEANLTWDMLDVESDENRTKTIDTLVNGVTSSEQGVGLWKMGDVLHSTPAVVAYGSGASAKSYIFAGTNRGVLHVFNDETGEEEWGFIPKPQLANLRKLWQQPTVHNYFLDGAPVVYQGTREKILLIGERRGGSNYYALDVSTISSPEYKYTIPETWIENETNVTLTDTLAQSWANPTVHKVKASGSPNDVSTVFLMVGGYDAQHDDGAWRGTAPDGKTKGNSVFMINVDDGSVTALDSTNLENGAITIPHSIVDATGFDYNDDTRTDRVYAGDLGGNIWAFEDHADPYNASRKPNGKWTGKKLFDDDQGRKIFYAPDVVLENGNLGVEDMIFFGTGDRAAPKDISVVNRIYAVRNNWLVTPMTGSTPDINLTPNDLFDATDNIIQDGTIEQQQNAGRSLKDGRGWYFDLEHSGEKIISSVLVYDGVLYFTTYTPDSDGAGGIPEDPCAVDVTGLGTARLYAVDYRDGTAVMNFDKTNDPTGGELLAKSDRSIYIGQAIPSSPVIAILEGKAILLVGVSGGIASVDPYQGQALNRFYWNMPLE